MSPGRALDIRIDQTARTADYTGQFQVVQVSPAEELLARQGLERPLDERVHASQVGHGRVGGCLAPVAAGIDLQTLKGFLEGDPELTDELPVPLRALIACGHGDTRRQVLGNLFAFGRRDGSQLGNDCAWSTGQRLKLKG